MNVQANQTLPSLDTLFLPQFFQLIKTGSALSDVREQVGELSVRRLSREFQQDFASWTGDALRIRKVFVHDPVKRVEQFFSESILHARVEPGVQAQLPCCPQQQNPTIYGPCR
jgi:hypothetical protein